MHALLAITSSLTGLLVACSQQAASAPLASVKQQAEPEKVYTYVEQMPGLPEGGGMGAIVSAFYKNLYLPKAAIEEGYHRSIVHFEIGPDGKARRIKMQMSSGSVALDSAILVAARAFPTFIPGRQNGKAVAVSFDFPISCIKPQ